MIFSQQNNSKRKREKYNFIIPDSSNPEDIRFVKDLTNDSYALDLDNIFCVFKSIDEIIYLIYSNEEGSIISFKLIDNKKINEIKNAHNFYITNFRHYLDIKNQRDLILSLSSDDSNIKLWNINCLECLLNINLIKENGYLYSVCFLNDNNQNYIITSYSIFESIIVIDFRGNKIKEINDSQNKTYFIDIYYDNLLYKIYIITGNDGYVKSYDYNENKIYHKYFDNLNNIEESCICNSIIINDKQDLIKMIESNEDGNIRIWNFHSGELLNKIKLGNIKLFGICLWNSKYLFVGCANKKIKLLELKNGKIIKNLDGHNECVTTLKKIVHPQFGNCLISQSLDNTIKLWINKRYTNNIEL